MDLRDFNLHGIYQGTRVQGDRQSEVRRREGQGRMAFQMSNCGTDLT